MQSELLYADDLDLSEIIELGKWKEMIESMD